MSDDSSPDGGPEMNFKRRSLFEFWMWTEPRLIERLVWSIKLYRAHHVRDSTEGDPQRQSIVKILT